jgi:single-strand DNA-binding protein
MFETPITVVGRIVTDPRRRTVGDRDVVKFRMASNARRRTGDGNWEPGDSLFVNVNCWGRLVTGVAGSLKKGDAVIVVGSVHTSEYDDREGIRRSSLEMRATAVGPDLARYIATIRKVEDIPGSEGTSPGAYDVDSAGDHPGEIGPDGADTIADSALPLSA